MSLDLTAHLKDMLSAPGLSGYEDPIRNIIAVAWEPFTDELKVSNLGSLHGLRKGLGAEPRPKIMLAAHMDAIGLMVTAIENGFLHFTQIGGVDPRILPGQMVLVHGREDLPGMVVMPPPFTLPEEAGTGSIGLPYLLVDTGLRPEEVVQKVRIGDVISFAQPPLELAGGTIAGHTLDNRASVAALTVCLEALSKRKHIWDVVADATVQEEVGAISAFTDPVEIRPDMAIVIDVTFANGPGGSGWRDYELGEGITITWGANQHPALVEEISKLADKLDIPYKRELAPGMSGTDAYGIQVAESGIPVVELGIPLRYMHTPVEQVAIQDIIRAGRLMAEFITELPADFLSTVEWR